MKILVLNGSPKKESNTMLLTDAFLEGMQPGTHEITHVRVAEKHIKYCQGCLSCWVRQDGHCAIQDDDMNALLDLMAASDMILWSFPLYFHGIPAPLKTVLDRTNPFLKMSMNVDGNAVRHDKIVDLSAKKNVVITGCGFPYYPDNFAPLQLQMRNILGQPEMICVYETPLLSMEIPAIAPLKANLTALFSAAGAEYLRCGRLAAETVQALEKPMLSAEMYIQMINQIRQRGFIYRLARKKKTDLYKNEGNTPK